MLRKTVVRTRRLFFLTALSLVAACAASRAGNEPTTAQSATSNTDGDVFGPAPDAGLRTEDAAALIATMMAASEADKAAAETARRKLEARCTDAGMEVRVNVPHETLGESDLPTRAPADPCVPRSGLFEYFDRGAAAASLGAIRFEDCSSPNGPHGSGHAKVTFGLIGNVVSVEVDPPFTRTSVGRCIAAKLRLVHVPPFSGGPVTVGKSFSVH
jgi:hypothetical protein